MVTIELTGQDTLTLTDDDIQRINPVKTHTGLGDISATVVYDRSLEDFAARQDRLTVKDDGTTYWTGYLTNVSHMERAGSLRTRIRGVGIAKRLQETRPDYDTVGVPLVYQNIALQDAIRDYWGRTPFGNFTVIDQNIESVATDEQVQEANTNTEWQNITSLAASDPWVIQNGNLEQAQTAFFFEGESADNVAASSGGTTGSTEDEWSDGTAAFYENTGDFGEYTLTLDHDIPEDEVGVAIRTDDGSGGSSEVDISLDGTVIDTVPLGTGLVLNWTEVADSPLSGSGFSGSLAAGSHTVRLDCTDGGGATEAFYADCVVLYDQRFTAAGNWDNTVNSTGGYLDDPPLHPFQEAIELNTETVSFNIPEATVNSVWNDTSDNAIAISNDDGATYQSASGTQSTTQTFSDAGRSAKVKFTADAFGSRTGQTPLQNFNGQTITDYELLVDGDNLVVIDELQLSRNHFKNLQKLHEYGSFLWAIDHDDGTVGNMQVTSFRRGEASRSAPDKSFELNNDPEISAKQYYNEIYLQGAEPASGSRPTATVNDQDEINNVGDTISPGVLRDPSVVTEAGAIYRARALLEKAVTNNDLRGRKTFAARELATPGFTREFDFGDGAAQFVVETVSYNESQGSLTVTYDCTDQDQLATEINELKRNTRDIGDKV